MEQIPINRWPEKLLAENGDMMRWREEAGIEGSAGRAACARPVIAVGYNHPLMDGWINIIRGELEARGSTGMLPSD